MKLPDRDLEVIKECREHIEDLDEDGCRYWETGTSVGFQLLAIIDRQAEALDLAISQRDYWSQYAGEYLQKKHLHRDDAEIQSILDRDLYPIHPPPPPPE